MSVFVCVVVRVYLCVCAQKCSSRWNALARLISLGPRARSTGGSCQELLFSLFYTLFAFVTMLPAYLWFRYQWINFAYVCIVVVVAVWNGANFYVSAGRLLARWPVLSQPSLATPGGGLCSRLRREGQEGQQTQGREGKGEGEERACASTEANAQR